MQWIHDNLVLVAFLVALVAVLAAIAYAALRGWALYRAAKREMGRVTPITDRLSQGAAALQQRQAELPRRQAEIQDTVASIQRHGQVLGVLASHASTSRRTLMGPLRYIGR